MYPEFVASGAARGGLLAERLTSCSGCRWICEGGVDDRGLHRRDGRHQAGAGACSRWSLPKSSRSWSTPATTSSGGDCTFRPTSIRCCTALSGLLSTDRGWGVEDDSFRCLERMKQLGAAGVVQPGRSRSGDAPDAHRAAAGGEVVERGDGGAWRRRWALRARVLPMSDDRVSTMLDTAKGTLNFQEYFVRERHQVEVQRGAVRRRGAIATGAGCAGGDRVGGCRSCLRRAIR